MLADSKLPNTCAGAFNLSLESYADYERARATLLTCSVATRIGMAYGFVCEHAELVGMKAVIGELWARSHVPGVQYSEHDMALLTTVELIQYGTKAGHNAAERRRGVSRWEAEARSGDWSSREWQDHVNEACLRRAA